MQYREDDRCGFIQYIWYIRETKKEIKFLHLLFEETKTSFK